MTGQFRLVETRREGDALIDVYEDDDGTRLVRELPPIEDAARADP